MSFKTPVIDDKVPAKLGLVLRVWIVFVLVGSSISLGKAQQSGSQTMQKVPVLVELFTSEGCSTCPPADGLLIELKRRQPVANAEIVALGLHVDYWNHDGWSDRFSSSKYTERQQVYAARFKDEPYTPELVIDGAANANGADARSALKFIGQSAALAKPFSISVAQLADHIEVALDGPAKPDAEVFYALIEDDLESDVKGGENKGRTLRHAAVVRDLRSLGRVSNAPWKTSVQLKLPADAVRGKTQAVAFVQDRKSGRVLGVGTAVLQ